ncbi:hypothetical protein [Pseudoduganella rhizocola]|uniref:hypothetical protein n=1 Tax=Pseudoduganella rhizocola TaxID=3382643 RepID=UPI0038B5B2B6
MTLPDLALQIIYGRLAWAAVLAALLVSLLPLGLRRSPRLVWGLLAGLCALTLLPGSLSPAYWLALAFHWPSGLLLACCLLRLVQAGQPQKVMQPRLAAVIAAAGLLLYVDTMGLTSLGLYYVGFGPLGAPLAALMLAALCVLAIVRGQPRAQAGAVLAAVVLFSALRLPSGNLWDALLDPLLWGWAVVSLAALAWRRSRRILEAEPAVAAPQGAVAANIVNKGAGQW